MSFLLLLLGARLQSALVSNIQDCDEVFNYWEPLHFYLYDYGFQTWEYCYQIRSWFYILLHSPIGFLVKILQMGGQIPVIITSITSLQVEKLITFYGTRMAIGLVSMYAEYSLYQKSKSSTTLLLFLAFSPGMFISSTSFLPSTFGMICITMAFSYAHSLQGIKMTIIWVTLAGVWGWPFCLICGLFYIIQLIISGNLLKNLFYMVKVGIVAVVAISAPPILYDSFLYKTRIFTSLNLALYNLKGGSELYGTEPWYFYMANGILNFNLAFVLALLSIPTIICNYLLNPVKKRDYIDLKHQLGLLLWFYEWLLIFSIQPHKEERFLYIVYPLICYNASKCLDGITTLIKFILPCQVRFVAKIFRLVVIAVFAVLGSLRIYGNHQFYHSAMTIYQYLPPYATGTICIGKEWYRFPSHFHLPNTVQLEFVESRFRGLLPSKFETTSNGSKLYNYCSPGANDMNRYDPLLIVNKTNS